MIRAAAEGMPTKFIWRRGDRGASSSPVVVPEDFRMTSDLAAARTPKWMFWTGWVLTVIPVLMMGVGGVAMLVNPAPMLEGLTKMGYPEYVARPLAAVEVACALLYLFPRTAVLGAILLTGYLGGAVATHVRVGDPMFPIPVVFGAVVWLALFLRDARVRALIPLRSRPGK
jgi:hypothetical protein